MNLVRRFVLWPGLAWGSPLWASLPSVDTKATSLTGTGVGSGYLLQLGGGLVIVLLSIAVLAWIARRLQALPTRQTGVMRVLGALSLGPRERVLLLQVGATQLLVGVAPGQVSRLHVFAEPVIADGGATATAAGGFAGVLDVFTKAGKSS